MLHVPRAGFTVMESTGQSKGPLSVTTHLGYDRFFVLISYNN
jgi:hypothetical protein